jgi:hypothetical protein
MRFDFSNRYLSNLVNSTRIDSRVERLAAEIANRSDNHLLVYGKSPNGFAASRIAEGIARNTGEGVKSTSIMIYGLVAFFAFLCKNFSDIIFFWNLYRSCRL